MSVGDRVLATGTRFSTSHELKWWESVFRHEYAKIEPAAALVRRQPVDRQDQSH